jgi:hypothetical protein
MAQSLNLLQFVSDLENFPCLEIPAPIPVGMPRSHVFVKQLDLTPKIEVGVYISEKDIQKVGIHLIKFSLPKLPKADLYLNYH